MRAGLSLVVALATVGAAKAAGYERGLPAPSEVMATSTSPASANAGMDFSTCAYMGTSWSMTSRTYFPLPSPVVVRGDDLGLVAEEDLAGEKVVSQQEAPREARQ